MRTAHTERLELVPVTARNAKDLWRILAAPDLRQFQDIPRVRLDEFERQVRSRPRHLTGSVTGRFEWLIVREDAAIGWISLRINDRAPYVGELGYSLVDEARGLGFASEALRAVVDQAFVDSELDELHACTVPENTASRSVLLRTGFRELRLLPSGAMIRGRHVDVLLHALHRGEWSRARSAAQEHAN